MSFRYRSHQLSEIVTAQKVMREGQRAIFRPYKKDSLTLSLDLDLKDGPLVNLRLVVCAGRPELPQSYTAALLLDDTRIRGVDYHAVQRMRFYRVAIPAGWHQNIIDPNLSGSDANRHEALPEFSPADLTDFLHRVARLWHIELRLDPTLL